MYQFEKDLGSKEMSGGVELDKVLRVLINYEAPLIQQQQEVELIKLRQERTMWMGVAKSFAYRIAKSDEHGTRPRNIHPIELSRYLKAVL